VFVTSLENFLEERNFLVHKKDHNIFHKVFSESQVSAIAELESELKGLIYLSLSCLD